MSSVIKSTTLQTNSLKDKTGTRTLASDSGSAWSWGSGIPKGSVIEQFASPCDGSSITVQSGTYTIQTVSGVQSMTEAFEPITGSSITYTPPTGTARVIYEFTFQHSYADARPMYSIKYSIGGTEVTNARRFIDGETSLQGFVTFRWVHNIGGSDTSATGRVATWTSGKVMKLEAREYNADQEGQLHTTEHWESGSTNQFSQPVIGITAIA